jgi:hypothetical protein
MNRLTEWVTIEKQLKLDIQQVIWSAEVIASVAHDGHGHFESEEHRPSRSVVALVTPT